jgi:uncharacterized protein YigA (DUF484 family)
LKVELISTPWFKPFQLLSELMTENLSALTVARFLQENPEFFSEHTELFAALTVPHPNQSRAISLGERQILTLRDRQKELELRLASLSYQATLNEGLAHKITRWCEVMLSADSATTIPGHIIAGLAQAFEIPDVSLRLWSVDIEAQGVGEPVDEDARHFAQSLAAPYCGPNKDFSVAAWLKQKPASMAMVAIKHGSSADAATVGLLLLGSDDPDRFTSDMGTTFLETIGRLASAAVGRLPLKSGS